MRSLRFQSCLLVSHRERSARRIAFHPVATVLKGPNDTGKSSVIKSLYQALGADPAIEHPRWKSADIRVLLTFTVDGKQYQAFRAAGTHALFRRGVLLGRYSSVTKGLGPVLAELLGFRLRLTDRQGEVVVPPPAYMFLPFYCDQDVGWTKPWSSFARLEQFANWRQEVIYFHVGIRSGRYYLALEKAAQAKMKREQAALEQRALNELDRRVEFSSDVDADIDVQSFQREIDELVHRHNLLAVEREKYRRRLSELSTRRLQLAAQKDILARVREELHADYRFSVEALENTVECPTCGQDYENSFAERFAIAQDEARAADLLSEIALELRQTEELIEKTRSVFEQKSSEAADLQELLARKRGDITFERIVRREGQKEYRTQLRSRIAQVDELVGQLDVQIQEAQEQMKGADSTERKSEILQEYRASMERFLNRLRVTSLDKADYRRIEAPLKETGSDLPRAVLAYKFAILGLIWMANNTPNCPIVVDSPNQQDQDDVNHPLILRFIRDARPSGSQLVLGLVDDCGVDFGGSVLTLEKKDFVLRGDDYEDCAREIAAYEAAAFS